MAQMKIFHEVDKFFLDYKIIAGDLNVNIDPYLDCEGKSRSNPHSADWLATHCNNSELIDVWRITHPNKSGHMWRRLRPKPVFSRLDYIWLSEHGCQNIQKVKIIPGFKTDHLIVCC